MDLARYKSVVFAGGGNRCWWQAGLWDVLVAEGGLKPRVMAGASAGAAVACLVIGGETNRSLDYYGVVLQDNTSNFYPAELLRGRTPFPHYRIYSRALSYLINQETLDKLRQGPEVRILVARPPSWLGPRSAVMVGFGCYALEKKYNRPLHPVWPLKLGFTSEVGRAADCADPTDLINLVLASSCTPPIVPVIYRNGRPALDGGLIDNVPLAALTEEDLPALIMLSRRYDPAKLIGHPGRTYVQPSQPSPVAKWDYTSVERLRQAVELGRRDAYRMLRDGPEALAA